VLGERGLRGGECGVRGIQVRFLRRGGLCGLLQFFDHAGLERSELGLKHLCARLAVCARPVRATKLLQLRALGGERFLGGSRPLFRLLEHARELLGGQLCERGRPRLGGRGVRAHGRGERAADVCAAGGGGHSGLGRWEPY